jgi:hypothetical protein
MDIFFYLSDLFTSFRTTTTTTTTTTFSEASSKLVTELLVVRKHETENNFLDRPETF